MSKSRSSPQIVNHLPKAIVLLFLTLLFACGTSATATPRPTPTTAPAVATVVPAAATAVPIAATAVPAATKAAAPTAKPVATAVPGMAEPVGAINHGIKETGIFAGHPRLTSSPRIQYSAVSFGESPVAIQPDFSPSPMLATSWSISEDFLTWTWEFRKGVQFHKGYGEMTVEDVLYTYKEIHEGALNARAGIIGDYWVGNAGGSQKVIDDYTVEVNTGEPWVPERAFEFMRTLGGVSTWIVSKKQSEEIGIEEANKDIAATGPWEIVEHRSNEVWRFKAVRDHWRQTPYFDELVFWSIPEESARVAGYITGNLDILEVAFDSIPTLQAVEGTKIASWPNAGQAGLNLYGQTYGTDKEGNPYEHYDPSNAWVSANEDPESEEWDKARKVRLAMAISIDRQTIVDTLLSGFGNPLYFRDWMGHEGRADPSWVHPYDPDKARELLAEAGYPNGFSITLVPAIRGAPAEVEACEAVGQYWEAIGIDVDLKRVPYQTIRPTLINRIFQGATCHTVSARLTPIIGSSNYVKKSTFSYGTEHPWMEENITDALAEVDPVKLRVKEHDVADWMFKNVMSFALYAHDGVWVVGPRLDPDWTPIDFSEVRTPSGFEYIKHR